MRALRNGSAPLALIVVAVALGAVAAHAQEAELDASLAGKSAPTPPTAGISASGYRGDQDGRHRPGYGYEEERTITCESRDYDFRRCSVGGRITGLRLLSERSSRACVLGRDWGVERDGVWVENGCRATFLVAIRGAHRDHDDDYGEALPRISCASDKLRYRECAIDGRFRNVRLVDRRSEASCYPGHDWGVTAHGVWVSNGCRAVFSYETGRGGPGYGYGRGNDLAAGGSR